MYFYILICTLISLFSIIFYRKYKINFLLFLSALFCGIIIVEALLITFSPQTSEHDFFFQQDNYLGWKLVPGAKGILNFRNETRHKASINEKGFRGKPIPIQDNILLMGDSFTLNLCVKDGNEFTHILNQKLRHTKVINAGVNGYGTVQQYLYLKKILEKTQEKPSAVVFMVYPKNDFEDNLGTYDWNRSYSRPYVTLTREKNIQFNSSQINTHHIKRKFFPTPFKNLSSLIHLAYTQISYRYKFSTNNIQIHELNSEFLLFEKNESREYRYQLEVMNQLFKEINIYLKSKSIPFFSVICPSLYQCSDELWSKVIIKNQLDPHNFQNNKPNLDLSRIFKKQNITYLDLLPEFKKTKYPHKYYFPKYQHWNSDGNKFVAKQLLSFFRKTVTKQLYEKNKKRN